MGKTYSAVLALLVLSMGSLYAQSFGSIDNDKQDTEITVDSDKGFAAQIDIDTNLWQMTSSTFDYAKQRTERYDSLLIDNYPFGGFNFQDDTTVAFAYNGGWYGGSFAINKGAISKGGLGSIKAWISFWDGKLKVTAGNDIGYSYADSQGADAGLRVYDDNLRDKDESNSDNPTIDTSKNPDNITQDQGLLIEYELNPFKIAFAGGGNFVDIAKNMGSVMRDSNNEAIYGYRLQYGLNAGSKIGDLAKINGSYILQYEKDETQYYDEGSKKPTAETTTHLFGVYGSLYPFGNDRLGITLGYAGIVIQYLEEVNGFKTNIPLVVKNGLNLTARYKLDKLTLKTDHNVSFWQDRNYWIYRLYNPNSNKLKNYGIELDNNATDVSDVTHLFWWSGVGASYRFTPILEGTAYIRNLLRTDETADLQMKTDYFSMEFKSIFHFSPNVEAYIGLVYQYTWRFSSKGLAEMASEFSDITQARDTEDKKHVFQIPIGFTIKLQR